MTSARHASQTSKMELASDPSPPNPFWYIFEDKLGRGNGQAKHASQTSKMEFGRGTGLPNQFRYTFEDKLEKEMTSANHAGRNLKNGVYKRPEPAESVSVYF